MPEEQLNPKEEYHHDSQGRPRIILPPQGLGKIIQVMTKTPEGKDFLFTGGSVSRYHLELLGETLKRFELSYKGIYIEREGRRMFKPDKEGERYKLINAGTTKREGDVIYIKGVSSDYGMFFNRKLLPLATKNLPDKIKFEWVIDPLDE